MGRYMHHKNRKYNRCKQNFKGDNYNIDTLIEILKCINKGINNKNAKVKDVSKKEKIKDNQKLENIDMTKKKKVDMDVIKNIEQVVNIDTIGDIETINEVDYIEKDVCNSNEVINLEKQELVKTTPTKIPVVLAQKKVEIPVISILTFSEPILEIRGMKKDIYLTEAKVIVISNKEGKVFIKGFIKKSIEYAVVRTVEDKNVIGNIMFNNSCDFFEEVVPIFFTREPVMIASSDCGTDEVLNEPITCELDKGEIIDLNKNIDSRLLNSNFPTEHIFETLKENMVVTLFLKIVQEQNIRI